MASLLAYPDMWLWNALIVPRFSFTSACNLDQAFLVVFVWFMFVTNPYDVVWVPANNQEDQDDNQN